MFLPFRSQAGHAAHFANVLQQSPLFSQERAPTSVAYAENQSMFLDSLVGDAAWAARYARNAAGEPIPWDVLEADLRAKHPYQVRHSAHCALHENSVCTSAVFSHPC